MYGQHLWGRHMMRNLSQMLQREARRRAGVTSKKQIPPGKIRLVRRRATAEKGAVSAEHGFVSQPLRSNQADRGSEAETTSKVSSTGDAVEGYTYNTTPSQPYCTPDESHGRIENCWRENEYRWGLVLAPSRGGQMDPSWRMAIRGRRRRQHQVL